MRKRVKFKRGGLRKIKGRVEEELTSERRGMGKRLYTIAWKEELRRGNSWKGEY